MNQVTHKWTPSSRLRSLANRRGVVIYEEDYVLRAIEGRSAMFPSISEYTRIRNVVFRDRSFDFAHMPLHTFIQLLRDTITDEGRQQPLGPLRDVRSMGVRSLRVLKQVFADMLRDQ